MHLYTIICMYCNIWGKWLSRDWPKVGRLTNGQRILGCTKPDDALCCEDQDAELGDYSTELDHIRFNPQGVSACRCGCGDHGPWDLRLCCAIPALGCHGVGRVDSGDSLWWWVGLAILSFHRLKLDLSELVLTLTLTVFPPHLAIQSCCHPFFGLLCRSSPTLGLSFGAMSLNLISALNVARILIFYTSFWYMILRIQNLFHLWAS